MNVEFVNGNDTYITESLYQWDLNQEMVITGMVSSVAPVFHFSNRKSTESNLVQSTIDDSGVITVPIPNILTKEPYNIIVAVSTYDNQKETTLYRIEIPIRARVMPEDYYMTQNVPIQTYESVEADIQTYYNKSVASLEAEKNARISADNALDQKIFVEHTRITQIASLGEGSTTGDAELIDARVAWDGFVFDSLGECTRTMQEDAHDLHVEVDFIKDDLSAMARIIQRMHPEETDLFASEDNIVSENNYVE